MKRSVDKDLIDSVYAVALEPERYEELTDIWNEHLVTALEQQGASVDTLDDDIRRSLMILENLAPDTTTSVSRLKDFIDTRFAVIAVNAAGEILEGNMSAVTAYGDLSNAGLSILPYDEGSLEALLQTVKKAIIDPGKPTQMIRAVKTVCGGASLISVRAGNHVAGMEPYALVQTSDFVWPEHLLPILEASFNLTKAESSIVRLMTEGCSLAMIAEERSSSLATVRSQVRSIFEKTLTHSQTELVRMAIAFAALSDSLDVGQTVNTLTGAARAPDFEPAYPRAEDRHILNLPDGRVLDYSIIGDPNGKPIMFVHCALFGDTWTAKTVKKFTSDGFKIIAPSRAFYQRSSPCPSKASPLETYIQDVGHLIAHLELDRFAILSRNIGSMFGFEIARKYPKEVLGIVAVAPALPFNNNDAAYSDAEPNQRFLASAAFYFPKLLELFVKAGQIYYTRTPPRKFIEEACRTADADYHLMDDPEIMAAMTQGLAHSGTQGAKAFLHGYKDVRAHTYEMVRDFDCPKIVMIGAENKAPRCRIASDLYRDGGLTEVITLEGISEFICYAAPEAVFAALDRLWLEHG